MNIWQEIAKPSFILAPMEAVTDHIFRRVVTKASAPDIFFTEFTNATGWVHAGEKAVAGRLTIHPDETVPVIAQIWGVVPEDIKKLASHCKSLGFAGIDINMGCPEKTATSGGGGAAMCQTPELASEIIIAAKKSGLPVSVKCRLGYSKPEEWPQWIGHLLKQDISALTVHLRTKKEMSKVPAHWEIMSEIRELRDKTAPKTLIIGNGDVESKQHGQKLIAESGIDGVMIGRGIFNNIFAFEGETKAHSKTELINILLEHIKMFEAAGSKRPYQTLKRFFKIYIRDFAGSHEIRNQLMETNQTSQAKEILSNLL